MLQPLSVELTTWVFLSVHGSALCTCCCLWFLAAAIFVPTNDPAIKLGAGALGPPKCQQLRLQSSASRLGSSRIRFPSSPSPLIHCSRQLFSCFLATSAARPRSHQVVVSTASSVSGSSFCCQFRPLELWYISQAGNEKALGSSLDIAKPGKAWESLPSSRFSKQSRSRV